MAEGLAKKYLNDHNINSAGTKPDPLNPLAIEVMNEIDIDISNNKSKSIFDVDLNNADIIITLCCDAKDTCFIDNRFNDKHIHWDLSDPAKSKGNKDELLNVFRKTRDSIEHKIKLLFKKLYE